MSAHLCTKGLLSDLPDARYQALSATGITAVVIAKVARQARFLHGDPDEDCQQRHAGCRQDAQPAAEPESNADEREQPPL